ncbi:MAG: hypothetical protein A2Z42_02760 [Candidatus Woykebacteria bacterium RBG_19FT_COMBO_43_10]|uniref:Uncharacterized protein n=1 Tax=Candidatus Woykebacteria bacterium RBG_19FT_COMBO_43_10 TaxID=1802598 RepID=A0A1G1WJZ9_9BACT|nr:MAG: hypothetical protein A2Z42_02760 [Candidatus Woykebacteria bacterium RBG_19FT_COMBO_43_10]
MKKISVIRERGQLTIPDSIRQAVGWATPMSAVSISVVKPDEIVIKPHQQKVDWNRLWKLIKKSRHKSGVFEVSPRKSTTIRLEDG